MSEVKVERRHRYATWKALRPFDDPEPTPLDQKWIDGDIDPKHGWREDAHKIARGIAEAEQRGREMERKHDVVETHVHPDGMESKATYSECGRYRYRLEHTWDSYISSAIFVMLNPSTATAFKPDPTVGRCIAYAKRWRAGGVVVLNLFALRSTDPRGLLEAADPCGSKNDEHLAAVAKESEGIVCAWGGPYSPKALRKLVTARAFHVKRLMQQRGLRLCCLAIAGGGQPRHPLYLRSDLQPVAWKHTEEAL